MKPRSYALAIALAACGAGTSVVLSEGWPDRAADYDDAYDKWTRHDSDYRGVDMSIDAWATLKSAEYRAAYVAEETTRSNLTPDARGKLTEEERKAAETTWEIELIVATHEYSASDFTSNDKSMWHMTLVGDGGRAVTPTRVKQDTRPRAVIESWYPSLDPFHKAYLMVFPKTTADGQPLVGASGKLSLRMGSPLGNIDMTWEK